MTRGEVPNAPRGGGARVQWVHRICNETALRLRRVCVLSYPKVRLTDFTSTHSRAPSTQFSARHLKSMQSDFPGRASPVTGRRTLMARMLEMN